MHGINKKSKISRKIDKFDVISFDIFDTLIKRNVADPRLIFEVIQDKYNTNHTETIAGFAKKRINAEIIARQKLEEPIEEITIEEIYNEIQFEPDFKETLARLEIETEIEYCEPNTPIVEEYYRSLKAGKRVILTSDMYLPLDAIIQILGKCKINGYQKIYLSSDIKLKKATGHLYDYIIKDMEIEPSKMLHIGDGFVTDFYNPMKRGIKATHLNRKAVNTQFLNGEQLYGAKNDLYMFINNKLALYSDQSRYFKWGYETFGPIIYGFCMWIHKIKEEQKLESLYFLARDMYIIIEAYKLMFPDDRVKYLEISRKSLRLAYIRACGDFFSIQDTVGRKNYRIHELIKLLNIDSHNYLDIIDKLGNTSDMKLNEVLLDDRQKRQINIIIQPFIDKIRDNGYEYLAENGLLDNSNYGLVDIGWHGTIQNMVEKICNNRICGLYFGNTQRITFGPMRTFGFWFDNSNESETVNYMSVVGLLEVMLFPNVGTTIGYRIENDKIVPVYAQSEMNDYSIVNEFQRGAKRLIQDYYNRFHWDKDLDANKLTAMFGKMTYTPTIKQAKVLSSLQYEDGDVYPLSVIKPIYKYIFNPKELLKDYTNSKWKEGFIKLMLPFIKRPDLIDKAIKLRHRKANK